MNLYPQATLVLADGSTFSGYSVGATVRAVGELVFNTSMTGYQEILTDPSYYNQIVVLTYPHIGNVGINPYDAESNQIHPAGLVIRELSAAPSNWRSTKSLTVYLKQNGIAAISGVDTRRLTRILVDKGAQQACIIAGNGITEALKQAQSFPGLVNQDLAQYVSTKKILEWTEGSFDINSGKFNSRNLPYHVVAYDYGIKHQILRWLVDFGCRITLVPAKTSLEKVMAFSPDGILLSNGPGDPAACTYAIELTQKFLNTNIPILGICLGFQLAALACGAKTLKMKLGHHGSNHPVKNVQTGAVTITSQNHGFTVDESNFPNDLEVTHRSLFDGTLQGFRHRSRPLLAFQGHPEASPGPHDQLSFFKEFIQLMENRAGYAKTQ